jgi:hypothetical protein
VELYLHSHIRLHGVVLNGVSDVIRQAGALALALGYLQTGHVAGDSPLWHLRAHGPPFTVWYSCAVVFVLLLSRLDFISCSVSCTVLHTGIAV